jgi:hypothetical protein
VRFRLQSFRAVQTLLTFQGRSEEWVAGCGGAQRFVAMPTKRLPQISRESYSDELQDHGLDLI